MRRPVNINYDGSGWNGDYVVSLTQEEFIRQFSATHYGHLSTAMDRVKAAEDAYRFITEEYQRIKSLGKSSVQ